VKRPFIIFTTINNSTRAGQSHPRSTPPAGTEQNEPRHRNRHGRRHDRSRPEGVRSGKPADLSRGSAGEGDRRPRRPLISVVIPLLNESGSLPELGERIHRTLTEMTGGSYEVIFVDDGSTDNSYEVIRGLHREDPRVRAVRFRTNYGKSAALAVGFERARGEYVFTMDADLQDDPAELPAMMEKLKSGYDLVSGWKKTRHDPWHKTMPSKVFNSVVRAVTGLHIHDFNCGLKLYRREVLPHLSVYGEMHRYLPAQAHWKGFRVTELPVQHHARKHGVSKFGVSRFLKGFLDLMTLVLTTKYAQRPLHVFGTIGMVLSAIGFAVDGWLTVEWFMGKTALTNRPLALLGVLLIIVGVQLISIGLIGEMIAKNSLSNSNYSIRETLE
jgi:glycosyltransferase involved in cell wall biosynthesis